MASRTSQAPGSHLLSISSRDLLHPRVWLIGRQKRIWISRATKETVNAVVKVVRRPYCISGITDKSKNGSRLHNASGFNIAEPVEVRVVMPLPAGPQDTNNVTAQAVFANLEDYTVCCADHRPTEWRENVDPFVSSIVGAWSAPGVGQLLWSHLLDWHGKLRRRVVPEQRNKRSNPQ
jgi:hypothetical protein